MFCLAAVKACTTPLDVYYKSVRERKPSFTGTLAKDERKALNIYIAFTSVAQSNTEKSRNTLFSAPSLLDFKVESQLDGSLTIPLFTPRSFSVGFRLDD